MSKLIRWKPLALISMFLLGLWLIVGIVSVIVKIMLLFTGLGAAVLFVEDKCGAGGCNIEE